MFNRRLVAIAFTIAIGAFLTATPLRADEPESDEQRLKKFLGGSDSERVLAYLGKQVLTEDAKAKLKNFIGQLGDRTFKQRQEASREIVKAGPAAIPLLRDALTNPDREVASRAKRCIEDINSGSSADLPSAAVRHLVKLKNEKAVDAFLAIYPAAGTESLQAELLNGLIALGVNGKNVHPSLAKALDDASAPRRAAAVQILLSSADKDVRKPVKAKLKDPDATVRYYAATGLVTTGERDAVPVLIGLIKDSPDPMHWQHAEECLYGIAGEQSRPIEVGEGKTEDRTRVADAWAAWWKAYGGQILLGQKEDYPLDSAVVTETTGRVWEWRADGKPRFDFKDAASPVDARLLPGKRVLIADERGRRVTERDFSGKLIWEKTFDDEGPVSVHRLPNGNTFVALYSRVVEVRRDGQIVSSLFIASDGRISDANKLPDGRIGCLTTDNKLYLLNPEGKVLKEVETESYGGVEALPNGNILVSQTQVNKIIEVDKTGATVWQCQIPGAWVGSRQRDGTTLVASQTQAKMYKVDKDGKTIIWERAIEGRPHAMHWR